MRSSMRVLLRASLLLPAVGACANGAQPDAYGNFEATEVVVSAQTSGQLLWFRPSEGDTIPANDLVGVIDTTQLALQNTQLGAQRAATTSQVHQVGEQLAALQVQQEIARRNYDRTRRLFAEHAATAQQLDQDEQAVRVLAAQIDAAHAQQAGAGHDVAAVAAQAAQIRDRITKSRIANPVGGTVLATFARAGEFVQPGTPLYKIADLDTLDLRAYVSEPQLASLRLGQRVNVHVDVGQGRRVTLPGTVGWISSTAEFTPTPVQTRDERTDLVYAVKIHVANTGGVLKIGMPADVTLESTKRS